MLKRVIGGLFAIGVVAILTTEAGAGCTTLLISGAYRLYCSGSVICDLAFQGGSPGSTIDCAVDVDTSFPIVFLCQNQGGNIAPGVNTVSVTQETTFDVAVPGTTNKQNGQTKAVIEVSITQDKNTPGTLGFALDQECKSLHNANWTVINAVPCVTTNTASLHSGGSTQSVTSACSLPVQQCDPQFAEVLDFNKKTGAFEQILYQCTDVN